VARGEVDGEVKYEITVTLEDGLWVADIAGEGLGPAATDVARFPDLETDVRDLIAGLTDTDPGEAELAWRYIIGGRDVTTTIEILMLAEHNFESAARNREMARQLVLDELRGAGVAQKAIGDVLGVSHQRVHQLLNSS
jgi:hypothetical protein